MLQWVERLQKEGELLRFKSSTDRAPKDSGLAENAFVLMIQTKYQKEVFVKYGHTFSGLDATHDRTRTIHYDCQLISDTQSSPTAICHSPALYTPSKSSAALTAPPRLLSGGLLGLSLP